MAVNALNAGVDMEAVQTTNSRVIKLEPVWSKLSDQLVPPLAADVKSLIAKENVLRNEFINPQYLSILKDAQDRFLTDHPEGIGIRSIMVSTDKPVKVEKEGKTTFVVPDINTVLENGSEQNTDVIILFPQTQRDEHIERGSLPAVFNYLVEGTNTILNAEPEVKKALTPAILVYDLDQLEKKKGDGYVYKIKDPSNRNKAILGLYLLDIEPAK